MKRSSTGALRGAACAGMFVFGIVMALVGAVMPALAEKLRFGPGEAGALFLAMNGAMLAASLGAGPSMDRWGMKPPMVLGPVLVGVALGWIGRTVSYEELQWAAALVGAGGGLVNSASNTLVADLFEDPRRKNAALNLLGVFFGVGALALPFVIGWLVESLGLRAILWCAAGLCGCAALFAGWLRFPVAKAPQRLPLGEMPGLIRQPAVLALSFLLFFESGNEFLLGGYMAAYVRAAMGAPIAEASLVLAVFWGAIMAARILLSRVLLKADAYAVVLSSALAAECGCLLLGMAGSVRMAAMGAAVAGFALAGIFPTVLGIAGAKYAERSGTVFGILFTVALCGGMTWPWAAGHVAEAMGYRAVFVQAMAGFAAVLALVWAARRLGDAANDGAVLT